MPADAVRQLGSGGGFVGKNLALAREIPTATGTGWIVPAAGGGLCVVAPAWAINGEGPGDYGMACNLTPQKIATDGVSLAFEDNDGTAVRTVVVPDGSVASVGGKKLDIAGGVVTAKTAPGETISIAKP